MDKKYNLNNAHISSLFAFTTLLCVQIVKRRYHR